MSRFLYTALFYLALPLVLLRTLWRSRVNPGYRRDLPQRLGLGVPEGPFDLWVHAVSVGETRVAQILLAQLRAAHPGWRILLTQMTPTGADIARAQPELRDAQCLLPWDLPGATRRFVRRARPRVAVILETELWPNLLASLAREEVPTIVANARLSPGSFRNYRRVRGFTRAALSRVTAVAAQTRADADRFLELGAGEVSVMGNIKFDLSPPADLDDRTARLAAETGFEPAPRTLVGASLHPGEDALLVNAFRELREEFRDARLIMVPRHPERFDAMAQTAERSGLPVLRRSQNSRRAAPILIGDSLGEMLAYLSLADVVVIGGSFIEHGGQNVLEPAMLGKPVLYGPHMFNFTEPAALLEAAGAAERVASPEALAVAVARLWRDPGECRRRGMAAQRAMEDNRGAARHLIGLIAQHSTEADRTP